MRTTFAALTRSAFSRVPCRPAAAQVVPTRPLTVLYIAGAGRSGSTLLNSLLGQSPDVVAVGELRYLWERGVVGGRSCACGEAVGHCPLWSGVLARTGTSVEEATRLAAELTEVLRARRAMGRSPAASARGERVAPAVAAVLAAIAAETGRWVIVDSSKRPAFGSLVAGLDGVDLRVVHLVRDPRATAWSWQRSKSVADGGPAQMQRIGAVRSAALWVLWNSASTRVVDRGAYRRVAYEHLVRQPEAVVDDLLSWVGAAGAGCFDEGGAALLQPVHAIAGNADRFRHGRVEIRADEEWRRRMPATGRAVVGLMTLPFRLRHGERAHR